MTPNLPGDHRDLLSLISNLALRLGRFGRKSALALKAYFAPAWECDLCKLTEVTLASGTKWRRDHQGNFVSVESNHLEAKASVSELLQFLQFSEPSLTVEISEQIRSLRVLEFFLEIGLPLPVEDVCRAAGREYDAAYGDPFQWTPRKACEAGCADACKDRVDRYHSIGTLEPTDQRIGKLHVDSDPASPSSPVNAPESR